MRTLRLTTPRLELFAGSLEISDAELADRAQFGRLLNAKVVEWPSPLNDDDSIRWMRSFFVKYPEADSWGVWYFVLSGADGESGVLIGNGGFKGPPTPEGSVEVGYSILEQFQRQGYASEAISALIGWAFEHPEVQTVLAETYPDNQSSLRVMEKNGLRYIGPGSEEGVLRYALTREAFEQASH